MKYFGRIDKIVGVLASLGAVKAEADVNRKIIMSLTSEDEHRTRPTFLPFDGGRPGSIFVV